MSEGAWRQGCGSDAVTVFDRLDPGAQARTVPSGENVQGEEGAGPGPLPLSPTQCSHHLQPGESAPRGDCNSPI